MQDSLIFIGLAFLVGILAGIAIAAIQRRRGRGNARDLAALREEFEEYREDVTVHFVQTAELINNLTQSTKAVYDHLERGAYRLVGEERLRRELRAVNSEPVMLEYLGKPTVPPTRAREDAARDETTQDATGSDPAEERAEEARAGEAPTGEGAPLEDAAGDTEDEAGEDQEESAPGRAS